MTRTSQVLVNCLRAAATTPMLLGGWCLVLSPPSLAAITPITGGTYSPDPGSQIDGPTLLTSYTTVHGTVADLSHAVSGRGNFDVVNGMVDNVWPEVSNDEIDGPAAAANLLVSHGIVNAGDNNDATTINVGMTGSTRTEYYFSQEITAGVPGEGNDFFLIELNGNDPLTVVPLDASGNPIGSFALSINSSSNWGQLGVGVKRIGDSLTPSSSLSPLAGVAFDIEDFQDGSGGTLTSMYGIGWDGGNGLDAMVVGVNSQLAPVIPEPSSWLLITLFTGAGVCTVRCRHTK